jgi:cyclophilin family peptidyl-prolyl cis-trans isomerase/HEAT repeat protein
MPRAAAFALSIAVLSALVGRAQAPQPGTTYTQQVRLLAIEDGRAPTLAELRLLVETATGRATAGDQDGLRRDAIRALGRLSRPDTLPTLIELTSNADREVRHEAALALALLLRSGAIGADEPIFQTTIARLLKMPDAPPPVIGNLPYTRPEDVQAAELLLRSEFEKQADPPVPPIRAIEALARRNRKLAPLRPESVTALARIATRVVRTSVPEPRRSAMAALLAAGAVDDEIVTAVLGDGDAEVRRLAALALVAAGTTSDPGALTELTRTALRDRSALVRYEAVRAWARRETTANGCAPLVEALDDESAHVALAAFDALGERCRDDEDITDRLVAESRTPPTIGAWQREAHAFVALTQRSRERARISYHAFGNHQVWQVRMYAARAAMLLQDGDALEQLASDPEPNVRNAALPPLRALRGAGSTAALVSALAERDYQLLRTAAIALKGVSPATELLVGLVDALQRVTLEKKDTSRDTRLALIERLGELATADLAPALEPLTRDFDPVVAQAASDVQTALTGRRLDPKPILLPRPQLPTEAELRDATDLRVTLDNGRTFDITLLPHRPLSVTRLRRLVREGYYNDLTFHRVVTNFVVQGGSPGANEYVGDGPFMRDELDLSGHERGTVGISTRGRDTGDAQIFINLVDNPRLDLDYTVVGRVPGAQMPAVDSIQEGTRIVRVVPIPRRR